MWQCRGDSVAVLRWLYDACFFTLLSTKTHKTPTKITTSKQIHPQWWSLHSCMRTCVSQPSTRSVSGPPSHPRRGLKRTSLVRNLVLVLPLLSSIDTWLDAS